MMVKRILGTSLLVLALVGLCLLVFGTKPQPVQSFRMADGSVVALVAVTYGTNQTMVWGKPYQRVLYHVLPAAWKKRSGARVIRSFGLQTNVPTFWLQVTSGKTNSPPWATPPPLLFDQNCSLGVLDEFGCEYDAGASMLLLHPSRTEALYNPQIRPMDPHGKIIGLCIHEAGDTNHQLVRFLVPGAELPAIPPIRQPLTPPKQEGEMSVEITSLVTGLKADPSNFRMRTNEALSTQLTFHVTTNGIAAASLRPFIPFFVRVTDVHGRFIMPGASEYGVKNGDVVYNFEGTLDPADGPYTVMVNSMKFESVPVTVSTNIMSKN